MPYIVTYYSRHEGLNGLDERVFATLDDAARCLADDPENECDYHDGAVVWEVTPQGLVHAGDYMRAFVPTTEEAVNKKYRGEPLYDVEVPPVTPPTKETLLRLLEDPYEYVWEVRRKSGFGDDAPIE